MPSHVTAALRLAKHGVSTIPVTKDKIPTIAQVVPYRSRTPTEQEWTTWAQDPRACGYAIIGGKIACLDFDEKHGAGVFKAFVQRATEHGLDQLIGLLVRQRTPSGGYHLVWRSPEGGAISAEKLAVRAGHREACIETKGIGGYFLADPSPGYTLENGCFEEIPEITKEDQDDLLDLARGMDERTARDAAPPRLQPGVDLSPGDDYNARGLGDVADLLRRAGWTQCHNPEQWRRPDKKRGVSATLNHGGNGRLVVFTSSTQFEPGQSYRPFAVYAMLEHGGNYQSAARALRSMGYGTKLTTPARTAETAETLSAADAETAETPFGSWPSPVLASVVCATPAPKVDPLIEGILAVKGTAILSAPSKGHKTFTMLDLALAIASGRAWLGRQTKQVPVLYLNFELSDDTSHRRIESICRARNITAPDSLILWNLRGRHVTITKLRERIKRAVGDKGVGLIVLDPLYKISANSGAEENSNDGQARILSELEEMGMENDAALWLVHHFAKGDAGSKNSIDRASGAGALARAPDVVMTLTEHEDPEVMVMEASLRDFAPMQPMPLRWDHPVWIPDLSVDPSKLKKGGKPETKPASALLEKLKGGMTNTEWRIASGWGESTYRLKRDALVQAKKVVSTGGLYYRAND